MTEKKRNIIQAASELFASDGYTATSTNKIAKKAGVSEGLVFRHFATKEGLLEVILKEGEQRVKSFYSDIVFESDPKDVLKKTIHLPFQLSEQDVEFMKLQVKLAWELNKKEVVNLEPLRLKLGVSFKKLGYQQPDLETDTLFYLIDGINAAILQGSIKDADSLKSFLINKYSNKAE